jgi:hypothetical protein
MEYLFILAVLAAVCLVVVGALYLLWPEFRADIKADWKRGNNQP